MEEEEEDKSLKSQICSEVNRATSCSDVSDKGEGGFLNPDTIPERGATPKYEADRAEEKTKAHKPSNSLQDLLRTALSASLSMPVK